ncbi:MAG: ABC transporter permease [Deltaproteobacteria bacterium]|nr:ABC transporter permease [Deltaproteobacteria bacterium]
MLNKKDIVVFYTKAKLENDIFNNYIGFLWWLLDPVLSAVVYYVVFDLILRRGGPDYIMYLFVGIVVWKWFQTTIKSGSASILNNKNLYKKVYLPKIVFPWIEINFASFKFIFAIVFIAVLYPLLGFPLTLNYLYLPISFFALFVFMLGISTLLAALVPFIPDINLVIAHLLRLLFYPSGILFRPNQVPDRLQFVLTYNPIAQGVKAFRDILMYGEAPSTFGIFFLIGLGLATYFIGVILIKKFEGKYAKLA